MTKIIYYYQTFTTLKPILFPNTPVTHIHLSSIHFGYNGDTPCVHLNDNDPNDSKFNNVWKELKEANDLGIKIVLMVGGAGTAYQKLFSNFDIFYSLLKESTFDKHNFLSGIDLDVEEDTDIDNIKMLIKKIRSDFGDNFIISMAPVQSALAYNRPGIGGFEYKDLYNSDEGKEINYFNAQCYPLNTPGTYFNMVNNGYPAEIVNCGMIYNDNFNKCLNIVKSIYQKCENFGGIFMWEYFMAPPYGTKNPAEWAIQMSAVMQPSLNNSIDPKDKNNEEDIFYNISLENNNIEQYSDNKSPCKEVNPTTYFQSFLKLLNIR